MKKNQADTLDIYWYETFSNEIKHIPGYVEATIIQQFFALYGRLPRWNSKF